MRLLGHYEGIEASVLGKISKDALPWKQKKFRKISCSCHEPHGLEEQFEHETF